MTPPDSPPSAPTPGPKPRRRLRLGLRGLMLLVLVLGGTLGYVSHLARVQHDAVAAIEGTGGSVYRQPITRWASPGRGWPTSPTWPD